MKKRLENAFGFSAIFFALFVIASLQIQSEPVSSATVCYSLAAFIFASAKVALTILPDPKSEADKAFERRESNPIEVQFIEELMNYAMDVGVNAQIITNDGKLILTAYTKEETTEYICDMAIPSNAKSPKDDDYKSTLEEMKEAIDRYIKQKEEQDA